MEITMRKPLAFISCDPGKSGAFCFLCPENDEILFMDTTAKPKDLHTWLSFINQDYNLRVILIEKVHAIQGTSAGSNFSFGFNTGAVNGIAGTIGCSLDHVTPKTWQKYLGVTAKGKAIKKNVAELIEQTYPQAEIRGPRGGLLDGRSDALGICHYASHHWRL